MAAVVSGVHNPDDKKKRKSTDVACFSDALEQAEDETMDLEATSTAGSASVSGSASNVVSANFEMNILKILAEIQAGQKNQAEKTDNNMAGINGVSASVETLKTDLTRTNNGMDSTCKTLATVASRVLKMEEVLAKCSKAPVPQFPMSPRADPRGVDPLTTNDAWARSRGGGALGFAHPPQTSAAAAAWGQSQAPVLFPIATNPYSLETRTGDRVTIIFGGFKPDTDKADIEERLRSIMDGTAGVERITSLGKFASVGKVTLKDKNMMWDFIKAQKGGKVPLPR